MPWFCVRKALWPKVWNHRALMLAHQKTFFKQTKNTSYWKQRVSNVATHWVYAVSRVWAGLKSKKVAPRSFNTSFRTKLRFFWPLPTLCSFLYLLLKIWIGWPVPVSTFVQTPSDLSKKPMSKSKSINMRKQQWKKTVKKYSTLCYILYDCILASTFMLWSNLTTHDEKFPLLVILKFTQGVGI